MEFTLHHRSEVLLQFIPPNVWLICLRSISVPSRYSQPMDTKIVKRHIECLGWVILSPVRWLFEKVLEKKRLVVLYRVWGTGLGDTLAMTTILNVLHHEKDVRGIIFSKFPVLFEKNPQVALNLDYNRMPKLSRSILKKVFKYLRGKSVVCVGREEWVLGTLPWQKNPEDRKGRRKFYLGGLLPDIPGSLSHLETALPFIVFGEEELRQYEKRFKFLPDEFGVVKASVGATRSGGMLLKNWSIERMQTVVLSRNASPFPWVQLGDKTEPALNGVVNLLGNTSLRETFYIISRTKVVLTIEGFISHVAAALKRPLVIIFSGYHDPNVFHYGSAHKVTSIPMPKCAPCNNVVCTTPGKPCTNNISAQQVIQAVNLALATPNDG